MDSDDEDKERPKKKQKKSNNAVRAKPSNGNTASDDEDTEGSASQSTIRENRMLKKKLTFIVTSLAQRGLITTDFIDLVEEDNVIELDEVKLCDSLKVDNSNSGNTPTGRNNTNVLHNYSNKRSPYNSYSDLNGEDYMGYSMGNGIEPDNAENNVTSPPKAVPFIQFL